MNTHSCPEHSSSSLTGYYPAPHDGFYQPQPPSPPLDTPELVQRSLPRVRECATSASSLDLLQLSPTSTAPTDNDFATSPLGARSYPGGHDHDSSISCKRQRRWDGPDSDVFDVHVPSYADYGFGDGTRLSPLEVEALSPELPMTTWPTPADVFRCHVPDHGNEAQQSTWDSSLAPLNGIAVAYDGMLEGSSNAPQKTRGLSLDSAGLEDFKFAASKTSSIHQPLRARTTLLKPMPELESLWESSQPMELDPPSSPQPGSLLLPIQGFDAELEDDSTMDIKESLYDTESQPVALPDLFDEPAYGFSPVQELPDLDMDDMPSAPSSPHSPLMQLLPDASDDMFEVPSDGTISPSLLGPPIPSDGLGLFVEPSGVDPPFARSPSPSDYELQILEGQVDIASSGLPEDEYQLLRSYYDSVQQAETSARERENALDRRVKDISALLDPSKVVSDPMVMYTRRQELRVASEMRAEARKARKKEKHRLREIGAILDLKMDLDRSVFQGRGSMRSVPQLVANMVLKRRDSSRSLAGRRTSAAGTRPAPSPLRGFVAAELESVVDGSSADDEIDVE
ncbi:hypothetical protein BC629DRAFT_1004671 [Irpex lacteus]|nr:hypothetical protein BC629DRAFT_1004671 [Irpex lacteus]